MSTSQCPGFLLCALALVGATFVSPPVGAEEVVDPSPEPAPAAPELPSATDAEAAPGEAVIEKTTVELVDRVIAVVDRDVILYSEMNELIESYVLSLESGSDFSVWLCRFQLLPMVTSFSSCFS